MVRIVWSGFRSYCLALLALLLASLLPADEKPSQSSSSDATTTKQQPATEKALGAEKEIANSFGMKLVLIRAGNFRMGSLEKQEPEREKPQHRIRIKTPFYLGKYEVTRGEFRRFVTATGYRTEAEKDGRGGFGYTGKKERPYAERPEYTWLNTGFDQDDSHPVVNVSWNDAVEFCQWLSKQESERYRLPTEAEWEWACRAGTIERWSCGDNPADLQVHANLLDASLRLKADWPFGETNWNDGAPFTTPVGKFKANPFGLHDMHGNVWEWCQDWYDEKYYETSPVNDPRGPITGSLRVYRGGSWYVDPANCRSTSRGRSVPQYRGSELGFRVARRSSPHHSPAPAVSN